MARETATRLPAHLTPAETAAIRQLLEGARRLLGADLLEARLFGSRARGQGTDESDVDVALIVTAAGWAQRRRVHDLAFDLLLQHGVNLAPLVVERGRLEELRARERRIALDIDREGIPL